MTHPRPSRLPAFVAMVRKDLTLYFSDRRALLISVLAPILIAAFFGAVFGSGDNKPSRVPVAVADLDGSPVSGAIVAALQREAALRVELLSEAEALAQVTRGKLRAAIVLPAGFGQDAAVALLGGGTRPTVALHHDPSQAMALPLERGLLAQHTMEAIGRSAFGPKPGAVASGTSTAAGPVAAMAPGLQLPFDTRTVARTADARPYNGYAHAFAGMSVQFILFMGIDLGIGVLLARRLGLWKRLRAAPLPRLLFLASHVVSGALIATVLVAVIYAAAIALFGVRIQGSVAGFVGVVVSFAFLTSSFGLLVAAIGRTPEATRGLAILATLLMVMLGGAWVPSFVFPDWLQQAALVVPARWSIDGLDAMTWRGLGFEAAVGPIAVQLAFATVFVGLAVWRFDWDEPRSA